jgi:hypothetical protein
LDSENANATQEAARRRWPRTLAIVVGAALLLPGLALIVAGFLMGAGHDEEEFSPCECPTTEAAAGSIDWAGTGDRPSLSLSVLEGVGPFAQLSYGASTDPTAAFDSLVERLSAAGYDPTMRPSLLDDDGLIGEVADEARRWRLTFEINRPLRDDVSPTFRLTLLVLAPDGEAGRVLDDLATAVGRLTD